jgi:hypothetical protein
MRHDLESAMGAVITSRRARAEFLADPRRFAERFSLDDDEVDDLVEMGPDLASLTSSFVVKREGLLRRVVPHAFELIGEQAQALLTEYTAGNPSPEDLCEDQLAFGQALVRLATQSAPTRECGPIIADLGCFELARNRGFWRSAPLEEPPERSSPHAPATGFERDRPIRLHPGVELHQFGWDLRQLRRFSLAELGALPPDPCTLVFFHNGRQSETTILRVSPAEGLALRSLQERPAQNANELCADLDQPHRAIVTLTRLHLQGVLEWA